MQYRADCPDCIAGAGRNRPHRRVADPEENVLSADLAGPLRNGLHKERYFLVAAFTCRPEEDSPDQDVLLPDLEDEVPDMGMEDPFLELEHSEDEALDVDQPLPTYLLWRRRRRN